MSAQWDRGDINLATPYQYAGFMETKLQAAAAVGAILTCYLVPGDGTDVAGGLVTTTAALPAADRRRNLIPLA